MRIFSTFVTAFLFFTMTIGCTLPDRQFSVDIENMSNPQLCKNYLNQYDTLYSDDLESLSTGQKQYLIQLSYAVNSRGIDKEWCERHINIVD